MADLKISELTLATPDTNDVIPFVDISDTSMGLGGTTKKATKADLKGDKGDQGIQGEQGIQGDQGIQGEQGLFWQGEFNPLTSYVVDDAVSYNGSSYICILASVGNLPIDETYWDLLAQKGVDGEGSGDMMASTYDPANKASQVEVIANKATDFTTINDTLYPTVQAVNNAINTAIIGLLDYRGTYDASTNLYPATGGSGIAGAILKGDFYICSVAGTLGGIAVTPGDLIIALVDTPAQTSGNWDLVSNELGYTPENAANKKLDLTDNSDTYYPSQKAVKTAVDLKADKTNVLQLDNTTAFTPDNNYEPATKKYVDDNSGGRTYGSATSSATPSINTDLYDRYELTAQAVNISSFTTNLSGNPKEGDKLNIKINTSNTTTFINSSMSELINGGTVTGNKPTGTQDNDIMFAHIVGPSGTITPPAGWTQLAIDQTTTFQELYYKIASSEGSSYSWGFSSPAGWVIEISTFRGGFNTSNPIQSISNSAYITSDNIFRAASLNNVYNNSLIFIFNSTYDINLTVTPPSSPVSFTEIYDYLSSTASKQLQASYGVLLNNGDTGNIDSIMSTTTTKKRSFAVTLNPAGINVTYGDSFLNADYTLPTKITKNSSLDLIWNSLVSKWQSYAIVNKSKSGISTYDISTASGTKKIAHNLGKVPSKVKIKTTCITGTTNSSETFGIYDLITGNKSIYLWQKEGTSTAVADVSGNSITASMVISSDATASNMATGIITVDADIITITWTKTGSPTGTANIMWEVE